MKKRFSLSAALGALLPVFLLCFVSSAQAQLTLTFNQPTLSGSNGSTLTFAGILTNTGGEELFLNGDSFTLEGEGLILDDTPFLTNFVDPIQPGQSVGGELFTVMLGTNPPATPGAYTGSFTILGGPTDTDQTALVTQGFGVVAAPEPGPGALLMTGLLLCGGISLRHRRSVVLAVATKEVL